MGTWLRVFKGRRAVSGAVCGMFILIILFVAITAVYAYHVTQARYNEIVNERHQMDWERINEHIRIPSVWLVDDGTLNASIRNVGAVPARLVAFWLSAYNGSGVPQWQHQHKIDLWISPGEYKYNFGQDGYSYTLIKPGNPGETLDSIELPNVEEGWWYALKIVTERGNVAIYSPFPDWFGGGGGGGMADIPIVLWPDWSNFQYKDLENAPDKWEPAYVKEEAQQTPGNEWHPLYRILVNNTTGSDIYLLPNCTMVQIATAGGQTQIRYIVSSGTTIHDEYPTPVVLKLLPSKELTYVSFAADDLDTPEWTPDPAQNWYTVGFILWFRYVDDTTGEARVISLPPLIQLLTPWPPL